MQFWKREIRLRRFAKLLVVILGLLVIGLLVWEKSSRPSYHALERGMTKTDVRTIMGAPRDAIGREWYYRANGRERGRPIELLFDDDGRLYGTSDKRDHWYRDYISRMMAP